MKEILLRYIKMENSGIKSYFDADEIIKLLDYFEDTDDFKHYQKVLELGQKLHPNSTEIKIRLCKFYVHEKKYNKALRLIEDIGNHESCDLYLSQFECFCALDRYDEIISFITTHSLPGNMLEEIFEYIAQVLNDLKKEEEAYDFVKRGLALFPRNIILKEELCYYLEIKREIKPALRLCRELLDKNPYSSEYWYTQGRLHYLEGDYDSAIDAFDFALTCDDSDLEIKIKKAHCLFINENYGKAIEVYLELLSDDSDLYERIQPYLAECYLKSENFEDAYLAFKDILRNIDVAENLPVYKNYILCCIKTERDKEAVSSISEHTQNFTGNLWLLWLQAFIHIIRHEHEKGVQTIQQLLQKLYLAGLGLHTQIFKGLDEKNCKLPFHSEIEGLFVEAYELMGIRFDNEFEHVHSAIGRLINNDIKEFCSEYEKCTAHIIGKYLDRIILYAEAIQTYNFEQSKNDIFFICAKDIDGDDRHIAPIHLSTNYLNNKHHYN
ncbi:MAG: hypothetical protein LBH90_09040 [Tannerella sp.]|jgi:tetratricopeptide (TPR) repeat protein|nr:hypothetical protein [Tannerella sp.]